MDNFDNNLNNQQNNQPVEESKAWVGVLLGLFVGLIGLVIGLLLYPDGTFRRKTFMKGWIWSFVASLIVGIVLSLIITFAGPWSFYY